ncbi:glutathione S-transferase [Sphingomonas prati]|uniref:Glutathione S-transferase n=1 Tax=Sphingomonas prati TaxID=1843237 RepID=A0A7W9BVA9_9SPHN|nr:glutathione S-transferase [Sphingomonas prati]MBB5730791.1 glutathione S-transferase [Sphingomonas prati]GGE96787.1 glutathione S-transferase [Sphingomonas prati]
MANHVFYSFRRCPYAMRARLALAVGGVPYELREVRLSNKPSELLTISAKGTVPVLQTADGVVIGESLAIMRWALEDRDPQGWLLRDDPTLIATNDGMFKRELDRYKYPARHGSAPAWHRDNGLRFLQELEARIAVAGQLCGAVQGLADAAIMPFVRQFAGVDQDWFAAQPLPCLKAWLAKHIASELFARIMYRVAPWSPGDTPTIVAGSLHD